MTESIGDKIRRRDEGIENAEGKVPEAPLPWTRERFSSDEYANSYEDIAYGVRAANAYLRLVALLRRAVLSELHDTQIAFAVEISNVLRDLGEGL